MATLDSGAWCLWVPFDTWLAKSHTYWVVFPLLLPEGDELGSSPQSLPQATNPSPRGMPTLSDLLTMPCQLPLLSFAAQVPKPSWVSLCPPGTDLTLWTATALRLDTEAPAKVASGAGGGGGGEQRRRCSFLPPPTGGGGPGAPQPWFSAPAARWNYQATTQASPQTN